MTTFASSLGVRILGSLLRNEEIREKSLPRIRVEWFPEFYQQRVFEGIQTLWRAHKPINVSLIAAWLCESNHLSFNPAHDSVPNKRRDVSWAHLIQICDNWLQDGTAVIDYALADIEHLRAAYVGRQAKYLLSEYAEKMAEGGNVRWMLGEVVRELSALHGECFEEAFVEELGVGISQVYDEIDKRFEQARRGGMSGVKTPFTDLNELINGWQPGDFIVVGARTSVGKTSFATNCLGRCILDGINCALVSVEQSFEQVCERLLIDIGNVPSNLVKNGQVGWDHTQRLRLAGDQLIASGAGRLFNLKPMDPTGQFLISDIADQVRYHAQHHGVAVVVVDYIQLLKSTNGKANRQEQVAEISRSLQTLARQTRVSLLALSQLTRIDEYQKPSLSDLRESGSIEQDADLVLLLWRSDKADRNVISVDVAKHRNGPTGFFTLTFQQDFMRFINPVMR